MTLSLGRLPPSAPATSTAEHLLTVGPRRRLPPPQPPGSHVSTSDPQPPPMAESTMLEAPESIFPVAATRLTVRLDTKSGVSDYKVGGHARRADRPEDDQ